MIELITVIVIVAVLAATALPKFINIGSNARAAKVDAMAANLHTLAAATKSECMVKIKNCTNISWIPYNFYGKTLALNWGYPDGGGPVNSWDIDKLVVDKTGWTITAAGATTFFLLTDAPDPNNCRAAYRGALGSAIKEYSITTIKTGC